MDYLNQPSNYPVTLEQLLRLTVEKKGSDLHLVVGMPPCIRIDGDIVKQDFPPIGAARHFPPRGKQEPGESEKNEKEI